jgi:hypothetical protein
MGDVIVNKTRIINGKSMTSSQQSKMAAMKRMMDEWMDEMDDECIMKW